MPSLADQPVAPAIELTHAVGFQRLGAPERASLPARQPWSMLDPTCHRRDQAFTAQTARQGSAGSKGVIDRIMETDTGRKAGYKLARYKAFRPLVKRASKRKED